MCALHGLFQETSADKLGSAYEYNHSLHPHALQPRLGSVADMTAEGITNQQLLGKECVANYVM